jgi:hypothetical protein
LGTTTLDSSLTVIGQSPPAFQLHSLAHPFRQVV